MLNNRKATFIIPVLNTFEDIHECVDSLIKQNWSHLEIICVSDNKCFEDLKNIIGRYPQVILFSADFNSESMPRILNRAISIAAGDVVFFISEFLSFSPNFISTYVKRLFSEESTGFVYGNFIAKKQNGENTVGKVKTDKFDYSESSQIGPVRAIKKEVFELVGKYNEKLNFSYEYDLRLRIFERLNPVKIDEPLYMLLHENTDTSRYLNMKSFYCYIPSNKSYYGESYLNYTKEEENEYRDAVFNSLKREGAFLTHNNCPINCPHSGIDDPLISVVIPLWNRRDYIGRTIKSVLDGGWSSYEIIVVDNGSTDDGTDIVKEYQEKGNIRLYRNNINNTARALNIGISNAIGRYVCQLDSDDLYSPDTLETLFHYMESNPNAALGVSYYDCIGPDDEILSEFGVVKHHEYDRNNLIRTDGLGAARIWHRCVLEELGGFDEENLGSYGEDYDLELKLSEKYEVLRIPHVLYHYRMNHKKTEEKIDYADRHRKKTFARKSAIVRRQALNKIKRLSKGPYDNKRS